MVKVGVIGLGTIGSGVAICLARAGMLAAVYDVRANADGLEGVPVPSSSCTAVARVCDTIVIAVVNAAQVNRRALRPGRRARRGTDRTERRARFYSRT
jgi:3-hydroxyisobutyrate dehydrogenase-like beta-hydroxyacid dehydrogenase